MNEKFKEKIKSIPMWLGIVAAAFLAVGINWQDLTTWQAVGEAVLNFVKNPSAIILFGITVFSTINNPNSRDSF